VKDSVPRRSSGDGGSADMISALGWLVPFRRSGTESAGSAPSIWKALGCARP
jgi:hypothetical protein